MPLYRADGVTAARHGRMRSEAAGTTCARPRRDRSPCPKAGSGIGSSFASPRCAYPSPERRTTNHTQVKYMNLVSPQHCQLSLALGAICGLVTTQAWDGFDMSLRYEFLENVLHPILRSDMTQLPTNAVRY